MNDIPDVACPGTGAQTLRRQSGHRSRGCYALLATVGLGVEPIITPNKYGNMDSNWDADLKESEIPTRSWRTT